MTDQPLSSSEQFRVIVFLLLAAVAAAVFVGIPPLLFIVAGWFLMLKRRSFDYMEVALKATKAYALLAVVAFLALAAYLVFEEAGTSWGAKRSIWLNFLQSEAPFFAGFAAIALVYEFLADTLLHEPLKSHAAWVAANGVFATKVRSDDPVPSGPSVDIIKGERMKTYSVADELMKWAKLKEDGHISEAEFADARAKLLKRPQGGATGAG